jgi:hypothetical protein
MIAVSARIQLRLHISIAVASIAFSTLICPLSVAAKLNAASDHTLIPAQLSMGGRLAGPAPATRNPQPPPTQSQGALTPDEQKRFAEAVSRLTPKERKRLNKSIKRLTPQESRQFIQMVKRQLATTEAAPQTLRPAR